MNFQFHILSLEPLYPPPVISVFITLPLTIPPSNSHHLSIQFSYQLIDNQAANENLFMAFMGVYSANPLIQTPLGPTQSVLI